MKLKSKTALVTGGSRGIGYEIAHALHQEGASVVITGRNQASLEESALKIGSNCHPIACDHSVPEEIDQFANIFFKTFKGPDILINNAGCMQSKPVLELSLDMWNKVIETNLTGVFLTTKVLLPSMIEQGKGDIIMISSMSGKKGDPGASAYAASKFGLQGFSQSLFYEIRRHNIRVTVINPSRVDASSNPSQEYGAHLTLHAQDLAQTVIHLTTLPGRTTLRDIDVWGTNP